MIYSMKVFSTLAVASAFPMFLNNDAPTCPGSKVKPNQHEHCDMTAEFEQSCGDVMAEIKARATGENGWQDPHNAGTYSLLSEDSAVLMIQRKSGAADGRGGGRYTDKVAFTHIDTAEGGCKVSACSDSQDASNNDQSTNFCNIHNVWCGSADGCMVVKTDLTMKETLGVCPRHNKQNCIVQSKIDFDLVVKYGTVAKTSDNCPGSPANNYESCAMIVTFPESCATVKEEMEARLAGEDNWVDPHNEGSYATVANDATHMQIKRASGKNDGQGGGRYMDLMNFDFQDTNGGCTLTACSDSQEESNNDQSTNYCNIRNLYKGTQQSGKVVKHDLSDLTETVNNNQCPRHDHNRCN